MSAVRAALGDAVSLGCLLVILTGCEGGTLKTMNPQPVGDTSRNRAAVPAGTFLQGSPYGQYDYDEYPQRLIDVSSFVIDIYEVTNSRYASFLTSSGGIDHYDSRMEIVQTGRSFQAKAGVGNYPVTYVTWFDALAFAIWSGGRLPTEAEWEKAARGDADGRIFPWGDHIYSGQCNLYNQVGGLWRVGASTGRSKYGCADQAGNAWEWTADWYLSNYYRVGPTANPSGPATGTYKVIKGGGFMDTEYETRCSERRGVLPDGRYVDLGFRCVYDSL